MDKSEKVKDKLIIPVITTALISIIDPLSGLVSGIGYTSQIIKKNSKVSSPLEYITAIERTNFLKWKKRYMQNVLSILLINWITLTSLKSS